MQSFRSGFSVLVQFIHQSNVGEGSPSHDSIIAASRAIGIEFTRDDSMRLKISEDKTYISTILHGRKS